VVRMQRLKGRLLSRRHSLRLIDGIQRVSSIVRDWYVDSRVVSRLATGADRDTYRVPRPRHGGKNLLRDSVGTYLAGHAQFFRTVETLFKVSIRLIRKFYLQSELRRS